MATNEKEVIFGETIVEDGEEFIEVGINPRNDFVVELLEEHVRMNVVLNYRVDIKEKSPKEYFDENGMEEFIDHYTQEKNFWKLCYNMRSKEVAVALCLQMLMRRYEKDLKEAEKNGK